METTASPAWLDTAAYPFTARHLDVGGHRLHYIDEGTGPVILFVHGTPTWSYLYRAQIAALRATHRCIAVDHIGFGRSDKPHLPLPQPGSGGPWTPAWHARNLQALVAHLDLRDVTLVVHDFGGPIGLGWAIAEPERVQRIVLSNTWLWETADNAAAQKVDRLVRSWLGRFLYLRLNASPRLLLKGAFADKRKLTPALHRQYLAPFPDRNARMGLLGLAHSLVGESAWYGRQWQQLSRIAHLPWLVVWGMQDQFITPDYLDRWLGALPHVWRVERLAHAGHFVQEEATAAYTAAIKAFLEEG